MTRFARPVLGADLLRSPEMQLRHPSEAPGRERATDEGVGDGFDQMSADAYAERWSEVSSPPAKVVEWYRQHLEQLGWHRTASRSHTSLKMSRDPDERVSVWVTARRSSPPSLKFVRIAAPLLGEQAGIGEASLIRVTFAIDGTFSDGTTGPHIG